MIDEDVHTQEKDVVDHVHAQNQDHVESEVTAKTVIHEVVHQFVAIAVKAEIKRNSLTGLKGTIVIFKKKKK